jgi:hypothetical protein
VRDLGLCMVGTCRSGPASFFLAILARHHHCLERFSRNSKKDVIFTLGSVSFLWSIDEDDGWWMDGWMELSWRVLRCLHSARMGA